MTDVDYDDACSIARSTVDEPYKWAMLRDNSVEVSYPHIKQTVWSIYVSRSTTFK